MGILFFEDSLDAIFSLIIEIIYNFLKLKYTLTSCVGQ